MLGRAAAATAAAAGLRPLARAREGWAWGGVRAGGGSAAGAAAGAARSSRGGSRGTHTGGAGGPKAPPPSPWEPSPTSPAASLRDPAVSGELPHGAPSPSAAEASEEQRRARAAASRLLGRGPLPAGELAGRLEQRGFGVQEAAAAVRWAQDRGYQSDREFAEAFARAKWRAQAWAPRRIAAELRRRGVAPANAEAVSPPLSRRCVFPGGVLPRPSCSDWPPRRRATASSTCLATQALAAVFGGERAWAPDPDLVRWDEPDPDQDLGLEELSRAGGPGGLEAQLRAAAERRVREMGPRADAATKRRRLAGWLQRRGYSWDVIRALFQRLGL